MTPPTDSPLKFLNSVFNNQLHDVSRVHARSADPFQMTVQWLSLHWIRCLSLSHLCLACFMFWTTSGKKGPPVTTLLWAYLCYAFLDSVSFHRFLNTIRGRTSKLFLGAIQGARKTVMEEIWSRQNKVFEQAGSNEIFFLALKVHERTVLWSSVNELVHSEHA